MRAMFVILAVAMLLLAACAAQIATNDRKDAVPSDLPPPPPPPTADLGQQAPAPAQQAAQVKSDASDVFAGEQATTQAAQITDIACSAADSKITFTITNDGDRNWQLDQQVPFPQPKDLAPAGVYINSYEVNNPSPQYKDGKRLFGPNEKFSDNCGGVEVLAPGEHATCTVYPVPLVSADKYSNNNQIWLDVPGDVKHVTFTCT